MQNLEHHCLSSEFPELKAQIHTLKMNDAHFRKLHEAYTIFQSALKIWKQR